MTYVVDSIMKMGNVQQFSDSAEIPIGSLIFPGTVEPGVPFIISYGALNKTGAALTMYGYIQNNDVEEFWGEWSATVDAGQTYTSTVNFPSGITQSLNASAVIGHVVADTCSTYLDVDSCTNAGCYWYNNQCNALPQQLIICYKCTAEGLQISQRFEGTVCPDGWSPNVITNCGTNQSSMLIGAVAVVAIIVVIALLSKKK